MIDFEDNNDNNVLPGLALIILSESSDVMVRVAGELLVKKLKT